MRTARIRKMTVVAAALRRSRQMPQCDRRRREFRRRNSFVPFSQGGGTTILVKINFKEFIYVVRHTGAYRFGG